MVVKVGDIVRYCGCNVRVMLLDGSIVRLSHFGLVNKIFNDSEIVEHVKPPLLNVGDRVKIHRIPLGEIEYYGAGWSPNMLRMFGETFTVDSVGNSDVCGPCA